MKKVCLFAVLCVVMMTGCSSGETQTKYDKDIKGKDELIEENNSDLIKVKKQLEDIDTDETKFSFAETEIANEEKILYITCVINGYEDDLEEFLSNREELYKDMIEEDWFNYKYVITNSVVGDTLPTTTLYEPEQNISVGTTWHNTGLEYTELETGNITEYDPSFRDKTPYEENTSLHMYQIAKDIVNSNLKTFCSFPDYYSEYQDNIHVLIKEEKAEVSGTFNLDDETYMFCVQFSYERNGEDYTYDTSYLFIEGFKCMGTYSPL